MLPSNWPWKTPEPFGKYVGKDIIRFRDLHANIQKAEIYNFMI